MSRIKAFRFSWCDAWRRIDEGYDSILETSDKGDVVIRFLVNSKPYKIVLTEKESEFIDDLAFLKTWNQKEYINECYLDGTNWKLFFTYDDTAVCSRGSNGFPVTFTDFLDLLHEKYNIPKSLIEKGYEKKMKDVIKETTIVKNPKLDKSAMYFRECCPFVSAFFVLCSADFDTAPQTATNVRHGAERFVGYTLVLLQQIAYSAKDGETGVKKWQSCLSDRAADLLSLLVTLLSSAARLT